MNTIRKKSARRKEIAIFCILVLLAGYFILLPAAEQSWASPMLVGQMPPGGGGGGGGMPPGGGGGGMPPGGGGGTPPGGGGGMPPGGGGGMPPGGGGGMPPGGGGGTPPGGGGGMPPGGGGGTPPGGSGMPPGGSGMPPGGVGMPPGGSMSDFMPPAGGTIGPMQPGGGNSPPAGGWQAGPGNNPGGFMNSPPANAVFLDIPPTGGGSIQSMFGSGGPPPIDMSGNRIPGGNYPGGFTNPPPDNPEFLGIPPISGSLPPPGTAGVFGGSNDFFNGGVAGRFGAPNGAVFEITPPPANSGWIEESNGKWKPPIDWKPHTGWNAPEGWKAGDPISLEQAPWNYIAAKGGESSKGTYIPGTLVKLPGNMTLTDALTDFNPAALGVTLPTFMSGKDFQKILMGEAVADALTQDMIKSLNPGKFGPMNDPYVMSKTCGLAMDGAGNFRANEAKGSPAGPFVMKADGLVKEGKFSEALGVLNDKSTPLGQFPDALVYAWKSDIAAQAGMKGVALENIKNALALAPYNEVLYSKTGDMLKALGMTNQPNVFINGVAPEFDVKPFIQSGRTMVPFRALAETMGADVDYDGTRSLVTMKKDDNEVKLTIGSKMAEVNGVVKELDVPAQVINGRTIIPLRFVSENLDATVDYYSDTQMVKIMPNGK